MHNETKGPFKEKLLPTSSILKLNYLSKLKGLQKHCRTYNILILVENPSIWLPNASSELTKDLHCVFLES